jgi:hypothetical protein
MKFVHPEILWSLLALSIPIIVHLFNFRRFKKVLFPNVSFLKEIKQETQSKSKLKHLLILTARMLALTCLIFAFAQPYIPSTNSTQNAGDRAVSIYIDNSFSMEAENQDGRLLELAKNKALEIVNAYGPTDKFQLLTSDFEGRHQRLVSKEEMTELIQEVQVSPASRKLSEVVARQSDLLNKSGLPNKVAFEISDFQSNSTDVAAVASDTTISLRLVPTQGNRQGNVYIDSVWFASPVRQLNQPEVLYVRLGNTGDEDRENVPLRVDINGQQKSVASANLPAKSETDVAITFTNTEAGFKHGLVHADDYPIVFDDNYYFAFDVKPQIAVMNIAGKDLPKPDAVEAVFANDPFFKYTTTSESAIDYSLFNQQNFIVVNQLAALSSGLIAELQKFASNGGSVLVFPSSNCDYTSYNSLLASSNIGTLNAKMNIETKVNYVNYEHYIYREAFEKKEGNVELPIAKSFNELISPSSSNAEVLLKLQNGSPFLISAGYGEGKIYFASVSLDAAESNFTRHAFFPASLLRMAEYSQGNPPLAYTLGREEAILIHNVQLTGEATFKIKNIADGSELIPEHRNAGGNTEIFVHNNLRNAGNYSLFAGEQTLAALAFNNSRAESENSVMPVADILSEAQQQGWKNWSALDGEADSISKAATELENGKKYWYTMIVWALILLAVEVLLIKFWRK